MCPYIEDRAPKPAPVSPAEVGGGLAPYTAPRTAPTTLPAMPGGGRGYPRAPTSIGPSTPQWGGIQAPPQRLPVVNPQVPGLAPRPEERPVDIFSSGERGAAFRAAAIKTAQAARGQAPRDPRLWDPGTGPLPKQPTYSVPELTGRGVPQPGQQYPTDPGPQAPTPQSPRDAKIAQRKNAQRIIQQRKIAQKIKNGGALTPYQQKIHDEDRAADPQQARESFSPSEFRPQGPREESGEYRRAKAQHERDERSRFDRDERRAYNRGESDRIDRREHDEEVSDRDEGRRYREGLDRDKRKREEDARLQAEEAETARINTLAQQATKSRASASQSAQEDNMFRAAQGVADQQAAAQQAAAQQEQTEAQTALDRDLGEAKRTRKLESLNESKKRNQKIIDGHKIDELDKKIALLTDEEADERAELEKQRDAEVKKVQEAHDNLTRIDQQIGESDQAGVEYKHGKATEKALGEPDVNVIRKERLGLQIKELGKDLGKAESPEEQEAILDIIGGLRAQQLNVGEQGQEHPPGTRLMDNETQRIVVVQPDGSKVYEDDGSPVQ